MQQFLESTVGQSTIVGIIILIFILVLFFSKENQIGGVKSLTYSAISIAIAFVLSRITLFHMSQGGSVTPFSMMFISIISYLFGVRQGVLAGMAFGLLDLLINPYVVHPMQMLLDYPLAFGALGIGGFVRSKGIVPVYLIGVFGRFICSVLSGVIFFGSFAPESQGALLYSITYNGSYMLVEAIMTCILLMVPAVRNTIKRLKNEVEK